MREVRDQWSADGNFYNCDGWKFGVTPEGHTVCCGRVAGKMPDNADKPPDSQKVVTKPITKDFVLGEKIEEVLLHGENKGGRPRKPTGEPVSRQTEWRREKEVQGVLV